LTKVGDKSIGAIFAVNAITAADLTSPILLEKKI
jgi:hypothetical protein